jgi:hypothetical protein
MLYGSGLIAGAHLWLGHDHSHAADHSAHADAHTEEDHHEPDRNDHPLPAPNHDCDICLMLASMRADVADPGPPLCLGDSTHFVPAPIEPLVLERLTELTISSRGPPAA